MLISALTTVYPSALNCFELGVTAYKEEDFYHSLLWMQEAFNRTGHESPVTADQCLILDYLAYALNKQGNTRHALMTLQKVKQIDSNYVKIDEYIDAYEKILAEQNLRNNTVNDQEVPPIVNERNDESYENYEALCRGEQNMVRFRTKFCFVILECFSTKTLLCGLFVATLSEAS